eukprot:Trichotokara_eunicae@DN6562_c0_g1_i1.p1
MRVKYGIPENEFLTFDAMRQAAQCVGRVIRSKSDYALMVFADGRYSKLDKRQKLPEWILSQIDAAHLSLSVDSAVAVAKSFLMDMTKPVKYSKKTRIEESSLPQAPQTGRLIIVPHTASSMAS